jgi:alpha-1,2-mannosyltransferase
LDGTKIACPGLGVTRAVKPADAMLVRLRERVCVTALLAPLRDGRFLTHQRLTVYPILLLVCFAAAITLLILTAHGSNDYAGRPLGTDFSDVYAAGVSALNGDASAPFDITRQWEQEQAIFGAATPLYGWHYPPFFLLVAAPLARLSYPAALAVWQLSTMALYLWALAALIRKSAMPQWTQDWRWVSVALGFTAVFLNLIHGHNGFLTAALFAGGLSLLETRPLLAGVMFGLLAYKPQFGVMLPLALAAGGYWRSFVTAAATVIVLGVTVTALFGTDIWMAFLASTHFTRTVVLEQGNTGFQKIQTLFSQVRLLGGPVALAYAVQGASFLFAAFVLVRLWRRPASFANRGAALCLATLLSTPYSLDYDLMLLAPALALVAAEGKKHGFQPFELALLTLLWLLPMAARTFAAATHILLVPFAILALLLLIWRRAEA